MRYLVTFLILVACWWNAQCSVLKDKVFIFRKPSDPTNKTILVVTWSYEAEDESAIGCEVFTDPELIEEVIEASSMGELIRNPSEQEIQDILDDCTEISRRRRRETGSFERRTLAWKREPRRVDFRQSQRNNGRDESGSDSSSEESDSSSEEENDPQEPAPEGGYSIGIPVIFPGTKWCGAGDVARKFDDLGFHQDTDRCCRAHDLCNDTLAPGETKNNLTNKSPFTKLSCQCDDEFYHCLDRVNSMTSNTVGNTYFNLLKRECYVEDYPLTKKCKKYRSFLRITCLEYEKDTNANKVYQYIKAKRYKRIPIPIIDVSLP